MIVTIDGPTTSGKSTTARLLARKLGFYYVNSGLLYRAVAYLLVHDKEYAIESLNALDEQDLYDVIDARRLHYSYDNDGNACVVYDGKDITSFLKNVEIDKATPIVSANKLVRELLLKIQRTIGATHDLVIDGRDTGTVVFPNAEYKFYLTAPLDIRARRWMTTIKASGSSIDFEQAYEQVVQRDERDIHRTISPLRVPENATIIDNTGYSIEETGDILYNMITLNKP